MIINVINLFWMENWEKLSLINRIEILINKLYDKIIILI